MTFEKQYKVERETFGHWWKGYRKIFLVGWIYIEGTYSPTKDECKDAVRRFAIHGDASSEVEYMTHDDVLKDE